MGNCIHCNREINNIGSLKSHENVCKLNSNRKVRVRSSLAGTKPGCKGWSAGKKLGTHPRWLKMFPDDAIFIENSPVARTVIRKRIIAKELIEYVCACCGIGPIWQGKPMPLILDHINGINNDHRLGNLRFVCSNCDTQLDTYKSKNKWRVARDGLLELP